MESSAQFDSSHTMPGPPVPQPAEPAPTASSSPSQISTAEQISYAREIIRMEGQALWGLAARINQDFCQAAETLHRCRASVIVTGMGKAGLIGQKIAATLASTGTRSHFLHPAEASHGDLGRIHRDDVVIILSQSGETEEITRLLPPLGRWGVTTIAVTASRTSTLGRSATIVLELGPLKEACALGLAPSTSTTTMLALGDALALVISRMRGFAAEDFARFHPGGDLGLRLSRVEQQMRSPEDCRMAPETSTVREVLVSRTRRSLAGRRSGAIMLLDEQGRLSGIFTDSDLARLFEGRQNTALDEPIRHVMTRKPVTVPCGAMTTDALEIMAERKISELPVVNRQGRPVGMLDITDLVSCDLHSPGEPKRPPRQVPQSGQTPAGPPVPRPKSFKSHEPARQRET